MAIRYKKGDERITTGFMYVEDTIRGRIVGWMNEIIQKNNIPFEYVDQQIEIKFPDGVSRKFPDIIIWERKGSKAACLIEFKPPLGWTPYDFPLVNDAQSKVMNASPQIPYFGTWNINELVLWKTFDEKAGSFIDRRKAIYEVIKVRDLREIDNIEVETKIKAFLEKFLKDLEKIYFERREVPKTPVDEFFISNLRSIVDAFYFPICNQIKIEFNRDKEFREKLVKWFVEQGWTPPTTNEDFERTARQFLYLIVDKILFYNTLRISFGNIEPINIPDEIKSGSKLKEVLQSYFNKAEEITDDYETVFAANFIETIPIPDNIVPNFRYFVNGFSKHDFSKIGFKDIGRIFDSLIPETERHKLGQYFTSDDVVDLINGFCIRSPDQIIADFGCGAGTFLVRGYARLKNLNPKKEHKELLEQLWGVDISKFPAHLSTINLAIRDLSEIRNYPKILCDDFFDVKIGKKFFFGPRKYKVKKLDKTFAEEEFPLLDAVVGNPPYTRQEELEDYITGYKQKLEDVLDEDWQGKVTLGKRAGIHAYFFIHGLRFLKDNGRFGYITSNSWLDVDYGKFMQEFFLKKTKIIAIIETKERVFPDADINTAITILERCNNEKERDKNLVKFVQLKKDLPEIILPTDNEKKRWQSVNALVDLIENAEKRLKFEKISMPDKDISFFEDDKLRIALVKQEDLYDEGFVKETKKFEGSKWGKYIRAPEIFFEILEKGKDLFVLLKDIAEVRFGIKTGANEFFYLTEEEIKEWGIEKEFWMHKEKGKWVPNYVIKSPRECKGIIVKLEDLKYRVLMIHKSRKELKGNNVLKYIEWGEEQGFDKNPTCASRRIWYDLGEYKPSDCLWMMTIRERFVTYFNKDKVFVDARLYDIYPKISSKLLNTFLNSTLSIFNIELLSRSYGGGGGPIDVKVYEVGDLEIINPSKLSKSQIQKLEQSFDKICQREIGSVFEEIGANSPEEVSLDKVRSDRRKIDKIIMGRILGLTDKEQLEVYKGVVRLVSDRIEKAKSVERKNKFKGVDTGALAESILREIDIEKLRFPDRYIEGVKSKEIKLPTGEPEIGGDLHGFFVKIDEKKIRCKSQDKARYIFYCAKNRMNVCKIPKDENIIKRIVKEYSSIFDEFVRTLEQILESQIPDRKIRQKVEFEVWRKVFGEKNA